MKPVILSVWLIYALTMPAWAFSVTYTYDDAHRIKKAVFQEDDGGMVFEYTHDTAGNLLGRSVTTFLPGDIDHSGDLTLQDSFLFMQIVTGMPPQAGISAYADTDRDGYLGILDAVYVLDKLTQ